MQYQTPDYRKRVDKAYNETLKDIAEMKLTVINGKALLFIYYIIDNIYLVYYIDVYACMHTMYVYMTNKQFKIT